MLQIRLSKPVSESVGANVKPSSVDTVTVACPDHLVLADLPVAKSLGLPCSAAVIKNVGRRSRRQLGERVHFCVRCDFPIAIYGRLSPCEHAFCLDCARSDSLCYLCDERVQKIQTIKMMEGLFICAAPHCLKSFLKRTEFESHIRGAHVDLINPNWEKEVNESSEAISSRKASASETTVQAPLKPVFSPHLNSQVNDHEDKNQQRPPNRDPPLSRPAMQLRPMPNFSGQGPNHPSEQHPRTSNQLHGFDRAATQNRQDSGQGSMLGYPPRPAGPITFPPNYHQPWKMGPATVPLEPPLGPTDGFVNTDPQGRGFFQGDFGHNTVNMPFNAPQMAASTSVEQGQGRNFVDPTVVLPPQLGQMQRGRSYSSDGNSSNNSNHDAPPGTGLEISLMKCTARAKYNNCFWHSRGVLDPHQILRLDDAGKLHQQLGFPRGRKVLKSILRHPLIFQTYRHTDNKMWLGFTDLMDRLLIEERQIADEMEPQRVAVVRKLLMMSANNRIPLSKIYHNRALFGIPEDFRDRVANYPDFFRIIVEEDGKRILELVDWDSSLAVSSLEKEFMADEDKAKRAFRFPLKHVKSLELDLDDERKLNVLNSLPLVSPYSDGKKLDYWTLEAEKYRCGVVHEFLSLTLEKRAYIHNIVEFKDELSLTRRTYEMLLKQPSTFYLGGTKMNWCVFLKDCYNEDGELVGKDPQVEFNERLYEYADMEELESDD
ncbi:ubiquitin carboxyl-terminal hydrolase family protein [Striga asiatica]|uniref:RING-type E3 ubiquitin transferase n=1 Tax=Striga asiatica TaxID=4170 RepID=A0A5A7RAG3_STRAF|nr:ubiquitin carboxyl-terminal hydrolase family protein [Striga asiatica]